MKFKYILTAAAVFCCLSTAAFADENVSDKAPDYAADSSADSAAESTDESAVESAVDISAGIGSESVSILENTAVIDSVSASEVKKESGSVDTGIGGVAAVVGVVTLAGAAVVISRKKS